MTAADLDQVLALLAKLEAAPRFAQFSELARGVGDLQERAPGDPELIELQSLLNDYVLCRTVGKQDAGGAGRSRPGPVPAGAHSGE